MTDPLSTVRVGLDGSARSRSRLAVIIGCAGLLAYASIKAAWGLGSTVGIGDPARWERDVADLGTWQWFGALWGTVLLDLAAAVTLLTLARQPSRAGRSRRRLLRRLACLGAVVVGCAGVAGLIATLGPQVGLWEQDEEPLAPWVFIVVYGSFTLIAASFAVVIGEDRARERTATDPPHRRGT